jgi:hypothetical protein
MRLKAHGPNCGRFKCHKHLLNGGLAKVAIKARLSDSIVGKETRMKRMQPWLHQVEAYLEMQCLESDKE